MDWNKDEQLIRKRLLDLANISVTRSLVTQSDFLSLNELNVFNSIISELPMVHYELWGGYEDAERKVVCFYPKEDYAKAEFSISCVKIEPKQDRFADNLTHRDFLGAILNLGIDRTKVGDILIKENKGYVFIKDVLASFLAEELTKVKHTMIRANETFIDASEFTPSFRTVTGTVSSIRLDAILAVAMGSSRSSVLSYISGGKVFVDGKEILNNSYNLREGDRISVRGFGKFIYQGIHNQTKKGRYLVTILIYI